MYLSNDDNSSTFVKHPLHKEQQQQQQQQLNDERITDPAKFHSSEESTMDSSMSSSLPNSSSSCEEQGAETKPCHVLVQNLSIEMDVDEVSVLNTTLDSCEEFSVQTTTTTTTPVYSCDQIDSSCCEPGAIEVAVAWDSFGNMVTYVTPTTSYFPAVSEFAGHQKQKQRRRSRRSSRRPSRKLLPGSVHSPSMNWDVDFPLRKLAETSSPGVRSADI